MFDNSDTLKECHSCYVIRPITDFHVSRWTPEGRKNLCKICTRDYRAERTRRLTPLSLDGIVRECSGCRETKPLTEFHKSITGTYGYSGKCKICARLTSGKWRAKNVSRKADDNRRAFYGLSPERYAAMVSAQNGRCAICVCLPSDKPKSGCLHVDHCHETGVVRGLLCYRCNHGLGKFSDDPELLQKAITYLVGARS